MMTNNRARVGIST